MHIRIKSIEIPGRELKLKVTHGVERPVIERAMLIEGLDGTSHTESVILPPERAPYVEGFEPTEVWMEIEEALEKATASAKGIL